jgi:hypothetical protein|tara:strand:- start:493 stop:771 length:279 start_codon:yes stop_codon:yes gene_type:complete
MNWFEEIFRSGVKTRKEEDSKADERESDLDAAIAEKKEELRAKGDTTFTDDDAFFHAEYGHQLYNANAGKDYAKLLDLAARYEISKESKKED